jgi:hypothetical protein
MRDINRAIERVERAMAHALDRPEREKAGEKPKAKPPKIHTWRAPAGDTSQYAEATKRRVFWEKTSMTKLAVTARAINVSVPLDPAAIGALPLPDGERTDLAVNCDGKLYAANLRKVKTAIAANGAEAMFVMLQGKLKGDEIIECGITAQVKAVKETKGIAE